MINRKLWIAIIVIAVLVVGGVIAMLVSSKGSKISADVGMNWGNNFTPDPDFRVTVNDNVTEVKSGDRIEYKVSFGYGESGKTKEEMNAAIKATLEKHHLSSVSKDKIQLLAIGYLGTGRMTQPASFGSNNWYLKQSNYSEIMKFGYGTFSENTIVAKAPSATLASNQVIGRVNIYLAIPASAGWTGSGSVYYPGSNSTFGTGPLRLIPVAFAEDTDTLLKNNATPTPGVSTSPTASPAVTSTPLHKAPDILPSGCIGLNLGVKLSWQPNSNLQSKLFADPQSTSKPYWIKSGTASQMKATLQCHEGGNPKNILYKWDVTNDSRLKWKVKTEEKAGTVDSIGTIDAHGLFKAVSWNSDVKSTTAGPKGTISLKFTYNTNNSQYTTEPATNTFRVISQGSVPENQ